MKRLITVAVAIVAATGLLLTCATVPASATSSHELHAPREKSLLIIGASYSAGWGATNPRLDYAHRLAADLGWPTSISAEPGAGYVSRGNDGHGSFLEQIQALPSTLRPGLVIIQGGRNDIGQAAAQEEQAVERTLVAIRAKFDDPQIVMVGDVPASLPVAKSAIITNDLLGRAAAHDHAVYIDPIREHWITPADAVAFRSDVPGHPNDAGHAYIAHRLLDDLEARSGNAIA